VKLPDIKTVDQSWIDAAARHQLELTKPPGSLGRLEEIANRCAAIRETLAITAARPRIVIFAADHGVCAEGVSPYPQAVTAQMVANFEHGGAAICALTNVLGIELKVADVGVGAGTKNFCVEPAMTEAEMERALQTGIDCATAAADEGCDLLGFGEMGIGNTTAAAAIASAMTSLPVEAVTGQGTGADSGCMQRKRAAVTRALALHSAALNTPEGILRCVGGFEIAAMTGFCLGAAARRVPVVTDGFIATAAAALAVRMSPATAGYLFAAHRSVEPGHASTLGIIGQQPLLDLGMRLGEGSGVPLAMKLIQAAVATFTQMATFASAGVSNK